MDSFLNNNNGKLDILHINVYCVLCFGFCKPHSLNVAQNISQHVVILGHLFHALL